MQFITALFGGIDTTYLNSVFALGIVLVLIVLGLWMLKQFTRAGGNIGRGRNRRLTVVDSAMVDGKRQVVIIRRDNVEHLIMTGGPQDLVIETGIAVTEPQQPRRPGRAQSAAQPAAEPAHSDDIAPPHPANWPGDARRRGPPQRSGPPGAAQTAHFAAPYRPDAPLGRPGCVGYPHRSAPPRR